MSYAFTFDASACSGCKTCQEACKDKNDLPVGVNLRRVIEVSGGKWHKRGSAWENSIFAYNLSLACNHCTHPKCAGVCPVDAYTVRPDGIVIIDPSRCMGCDYCAWACPYGAPQHDNRRGVMTKCDFCYDRLDAGMPPSCVAACPLRVLDYVRLEDFPTTSQAQNLWHLPATEHPFPMPDYSRTEPHLVIKPHTGMNSSLAKVVSNQEELQPQYGSGNIHRATANREIPLVGFTLLTQAAAGLAIFSLLLSPIPLAVLLSIGILLVAGGSIAFLHLGRKRNAWRSILHLKKSWLSREVLLAGLFGAAWMFQVGARWIWNTHPRPWLMAILGLGFIYCTARVYFLRAVPSWNSWRTPVTFLLSALILGALGMNIFIPHPGWLIVAAIGMLAEIGLISTAQSTNGDKTGKLRIAFLGLGIFSALFMTFVPQVNRAWIALLILLIATTAEIIGRWHFYAERKPFPMSFRRVGNS